MNNNINTTKIAEGINSAVKDELRSTGWPVYEHYNYEIIEESGEVFVVAPLWEGRRKKANRGALEGPFNPFDPMLDVKQWYAPLRTPDLLLDLVEIAERPITPEVVKLWANNYGLLASSREEDTLEHVSGFGRRESLRSFAKAAGEVRACLRIYEDLLDEKEESLTEFRQYTMSLPEDLVRELLSEIVRGHLAGEERPAVYSPALYSVIAQVIQRRLHEHCYPQLTTFTRAGKPSGRFGFGCGFHTLLGAVWLQLAWLLSAEGQPRRCKLPTCRRIIKVEPGQPADPGWRETYVHGKHKTRSDREFCKGRPCRQNYWYRKSAGWPGYV